MKLCLSILLFVCVSINLVDCEQSNGLTATTQWSPVKNDDQCPLWHFFNATTNLCECNISSSIVKCSEQGINLRVGHCMTYEEQEEGSSVIYLAHCNYFSGNFSTIDNGQFIELSVRNPSELNDTMCGPMNRQGRLCSECIEGFGPSIISLGLVCCNCTDDVWYKVPLYLFLEFVPITVFYIVILLFRVNITSAPMVAFVFYSQIVVSAFLYSGTDVNFANSTAFYFFHIYIMFYGFWNLDFFRYILPPFCVSSKLKNIHILVIDYVSAFYPLCLISITWIIVKLHYYNFKPVVWLWSKLSKCSCNMHARDQSLSRSNSLIDVFTTFFLLSFSKLVYTGAIILLPLQTMVYVNYTLDQSLRYQLSEDPRINYFKRKHLPYALISISIVLLLILPPVVLLILYPIKVFRLLLFKCHLSTRTIAALNIFVEKYYSCYRDGTEGGKDMRSLASMYFILRLITILIFQITSQDTSLTFDVVFFATYGIVIALVRPYKKMYMNIIDTLIMANLALLALMSGKLHLEDSNTSLVLITICIFVPLPLLGLTGFIAYRILRRIKNERDLFHTKMESRKWRSSKATAIAQQDLNDDPELPDRVLHPQQYNFVKMKNFTNVNYVKAS